MKRLLAKISVLLITLLLLPTTAFAQVSIAGAIASVFLKLFGLIANIFATITGLFLGIAVNIFNWVLSENFISLSYTNAGLSLGDPNFNQFLYIGWTLTRDLTNIFFVIALVAIGLGTALRIQDYQAKKALPTLIIIALLINFTPVICGLIVDASNIVMNFFTTGGGREGYAGASAIANFATRQWQNPVFSSIGDQRFWNPFDNLAAVAGSMAMTFFNFIAGLIYLLFAFIFILRYVAIWTLVILSPFAFACYILPATRKVFSQWWRQFIQWSLVGAIAAFFLYLGDHLISATMTKGFIEGGVDEIANAPGFAPIMNALLPPLVAIAFLFIGLIMSLTFAPKGADTIMKAGERGIKKGATLAAKGYSGVLAAPVTMPRQTIKRYQEARRMGFGRKEAFGLATERYWRPKEIWRLWKPPLPGRPAGPSLRAAGRGFKKSVKEVWRATIRAKKKKKGERCPICDSALPEDADFCPNCKHVF